MCVCVKLLVWLASTELVKLVVFYNPNLDKKCRWSNCLIILLFVGLD